MVEFAAEALVDEELKAGAERFVRQTGDDVRGEGLLEKQSGIGLIDATLTHVEESGIVELPHRAAVRTLHVVGIDL